ncbi:MAG: hypothetical protein D6776_09380 [Planctomycetota bacterium]|nr:MAG: hypothetical protein D6776_09380 [Planctomycetota bacterium]
MAPRRVRGDRWGLVAFGLLALALRAVGAPLPDLGAEASFTASPLERDLERLLPGVIETPAFVIHFRPGRRGETQAAAIGERATTALVAAREAFGLKPVGKRPLFVYESCVDMARLLGRPVERAIAIGHALHVPVDAPELEAAVLGLLEPWWGRAGGYLGGSLEEGRWYHLRARLAKGRFTLTLDDGAGCSATVRSGPGRLGFGVARGRLAVRDWKLRRLEGEDPDSVPWLRPEVQPEVEGRWSRRGDVLEGVQYGRMTRARLQTPPVGDFELEAEVRVAAGSQVELFFHERGAEAERLLVAPGAVLFNGRLAVGPHPALREGLAEAFAARRTGRDLVPLARALLERGRLVDAERLRFGFPRSPTERTFRRIQLAAFVDFLWRRFGLERYRALHFDPLLGARTPLGTLEELDASWREALREHKLGREAFEAAVHTLGLDVLDPPRAWREVPLRFGDGGLLARGAGNWRALRGRLLYRAPVGAKVGYVVAPVGVASRCAIAVRLRFDPGTEVKISVRGVDQRKGSGVVSTAGAAITAEGAAPLARSEAPLAFGEEHDVVFALADGGGRLYVDGRLRCETRSGLTRGPGRFAIEVTGPRAELSSLRVRELEP